MGGGGRGRARRWRPRGLRDLQPPDRFLALAQSVTGRTQGIAVAVYLLVLTVQGLAVLVLLGLRWPLPPRQRFALAWAMLGAAPYVISASYLEPRFFYTTVPALSMLVYDGLERVSAWQVWRGRRTAAACGLLAAVTLFNRAALVPLMPFELDERAYRERIGALGQDHRGGTLLAALAVRLLLSAAVVRRVGGAHVQPDVRQRRGVHHRIVHAPGRATRCAPGDAAALT